VSDIISFIIIIIIVFKKKKRKEIRGIKYFSFLIGDDAGDLSFIKGDLIEVVEYGKFYK
jgi:hypothetical protein